MRLCADDTDSFERIQDRIEHKHRVLVFESIYILDATGCNIAERALIKTHCPTIATRCLFHDGSSKLEEGPSGPFLSICSRCWISCRRQSLDVRLPCRRNQQQDDDAACPRSGAFRTRISTFLATSLSNAGAVGRNGGCDRPALPRCSSSTRAKNADSKKLCVQRGQHCLLAFCLCADTPTLRHQQ